jgi:probable HAF family extracellular repeat protein
VTSITNDGRMTGVMLRLTPFSRIAFRTLADGSLQQLGTTAFDSIGLDMNDTGEATGSELRSVNGLDETAFRFSDGAGQLDLGTLGGVRSGGQAINNAGVVVGWSESTVDGSWSRAFRARPGLPMEDLGTIWGVNAAATAINDAGAIAGWSEGGAFLYTDADGMVSLNSRVAAYPWRPLYAATGINNAGQIVVTFYTDGLGTGTARLVPVIDNEPPVITFVEADPAVLTPADGKMRLVRIWGVVTDDFDPSPRCAIASVTNSEPPSSGQDPDVEITGAVTVMLRASRLGMNTGRAYTIRLGCTDNSGNIGTADVVVRVPHDNRSN